MLEKIAYRMLQEHCPILSDSGEVVAVANADGSCFGLYCGPSDFRSELGRLYRRTGWLLQVRMVAEHTEKAWDAIRRILLDYRLTFTKVSSGVITLYHFLETSNFLETDRKNTCIVALCSALAQAGVLPSTNSAEGMKKIPGTDYLYYENSHERLKGNLAEKNVYIRPELTFSKGFPMEKALHLLMAQQMLEELDRYEQPGFLLDSSWRVLYANSSLDSGEFLIRSGEQDPADPSVTWLSDNRFIVVWEEEEFLLASGGNVLAQIFDRNGTGVSPVFRINEHSGKEGERTEPVISLVKRGHALVSWEQKDKIYGRLITQSGTVIGNELLISWDGASDDSKSSVSVLTNGDFVVVWSGIGVDLSFSVNGEIIRVNSSSRQTVAPKKYTQTTPMPSAPPAIAKESNATLPTSSKPTLQKKHSESAGYPSVVVGAIAGFGGLLLGAGISSCLCWYIYRKGMFYTGIRSHELEDMQEEDLAKNTNAGSSFHV